LIIIVAPMALLISIVLARFSEGMLRTAAITLVVLFSAYAFYLQASRNSPAYVWCGWNVVAADLETTGSDTQLERIYAFEDLVAYHLWFALRDSEPFKVFVVKGVEGMAEDPSYFLPRGFDGVARAELQGISEPRIWLAFRTDKAGQEFPLFDALKDLGYIRCKLSPTKFGTTTIFLMEMAKEPGGCSR
jgi:hypothetical protein